MGKAPATAIIVVSLCWCVCCLSGE